ncbi:MAG: tRNA-dihydrouridine synthase family protein [Proteobacteria bacterium]|nr:tRNA-dihydrouridine synthase family protein [Pseudomonadota bacterium]
MRDRITRFDVSSASLGQLGLAPMEGVTDFAFRLWMSILGPPQFSWTPFLRFTDTFPRSIPEYFIPELESPGVLTQMPVIPQLMGPNVDDFVRAADLVLKIAPWVDINCGCPSPTVVGNRSGSSLLEKVEVFSEFIHKSSLHLGPQRLSVKMRTGFIHSNEFNSLFESICGLPLKFVTVHGRSRLDRYKGKSNWTLPMLASKRTSMPILISGDIHRFAHIQSIFADQSKIYSGIVGRGALRNPWIFSGKSKAPVLKALCVFGLIQNLWLSDPGLLLLWAKDGHGMKTAGVDSESWIRVIESLNKFSGVSVAEIAEVDLSPRALARVKMLWSYIRSSLPGVFMDPSILRSSRWSVFYSHIQNICQLNHFSEDELPLLYDEERDWLYSGESREAFNLHQSI